MIPRARRRFYGVPVLDGRGSRRNWRREFANDLPVLLSADQHASVPGGGSGADQSGDRPQSDEAAMRSPGAMTLWSWSRSDSTLRGHFRPRRDALGRTLTGVMKTPLPASGHPLPVGRGEGSGRGRSDVPPVLLVPYFEAGGRYTVDDVHYVAEGEELVPAAETPLPGTRRLVIAIQICAPWVEEKTGGAVRGGRR